VVLLLAAVGVFLLGALAALLAASSSKLAGISGVTGAVAGSLLGLSALVRFLAGGQGAVEFTAAWAVPGGSFALRLDGVSALFLLPSFLLSGLCALYGHEYLVATHLGDRRGRAWFFFNLLAASIVVVFLARNAVLFLVAWEVMAVSSFFLVTLEDEEEQAREAGWTYLVASHLGTAVIITLFALLGSRAGSLDFRDFAAVAGGEGSRAGLLFILALVGFGVKAGLMPLHVWLPEAHPAAPSHVSALMSAVMIKTGIYGIVRMLGFLGPPAAWWGWVLIGAGAVSGIVGVLYALAQHDLKRLLAYHSVENIGIITMGLGVGVLGLSSGIPWLAALGFAGALLHVVNHAIFKGLLFLGAGAVLAATGTRDLERLGGLLRLARFTGATFLVGAAAISGLPPLNGFVSEFLILIGATKGVAALPAETVVPLLVVAGALVLIGGLACACFAKAFGIVFLGTPRAPLGRAVADPGAWMTLPMAILAAACPAIGLLSPWIVPRLGAAIAEIAGGAGAPMVDPLGEAGSWLARFVACAVALIVLTGFLLLLRRLVLARREVRGAETWGCGYLAPTPRMQYTASSFAEPLTSLFRPLLGTRRQGALPSGLFPRHASFSTETPDSAREHLYAPLVLAVQGAAARWRGLQRGRLQLYVLYVAATLVVLLLWEFAWNR
jgi:formate hydrogenlyase subunit 3/multisubunit Na+/H+ antiporter MnhD subunit